MAKQQQAKKGAAAPEWARSSCQAATTAETTDNLLGELDDEGAETEGQASIPALSENGAGPYLPQLPILSPLCQSGPGTTYFSWLNPI